MDKKIALTIFLGCLTATAPLSTDMYLPALPSMNQEFNVGTSLIQMTISATMIGMAVGQLLAGPISDIFGRKIPLATGMIFFMLASVGCVFVNDIKIFLLLRLIQGLSGAFGIVIARAIARDCASGSELTRLFSMLMIVNGFAPIFAPVVGGQILRIADWRGIFMLLTLIGLALAVSTIKFKETLPSRLRAKNFASSFKNFGVLLRDKYFLGHCLLQSASFGSFFAYISGSSFLFQDIYNVSPQTYSYIFGGFGVALMIAGTVPIRLAGKVSELKMLSYSITQAFVGGVLFMLAVLFKAPIELAILSLLVMVPMNSIWSAASFSLSMKDHSREAGAASALLGFFSMITAGIVSPLVGIAGNTNALPMAVLILIGQILTLIIARTMIYPKR